MKTSTLRPGLLVVLKTSIRGNVDYEKTTIEPDHVTAEGSKEAEWRTRRVIADPVEHEKAVRVRTDASGLIRKVCLHTAFGHLCPEADGDKLDEAIRQARVMVDTFNTSATLSRVGVYTLVGRIAPDDVEAVKAINSEIEGLMRLMQEGLKNLDVKMVREAAGKARELGQMLTPDAQARVQIAIDAARESAKQIVKAGEQAAIEVDLATIRRIDEQRTAFLDLDEVVREVVAPVAEAARAVDFEPVAPTVPPAARTAMPDLDWMRD